MCLELKALQENVKCYVLYASNCSIFAKKRMRILISGATVWLFLLVYIFLNPIILYGKIILIQNIVKEEASISFWKFDLIKQIYIGDKEEPLTDFVYVFS